VQAVALSTDALYITYVVKWWWETVSYVMLFILLFLLKPYHVDDVVQALLADHNMLSDGTRKYIKQYRVNLNHRQSAWTRLQMEKNLYVLTGLLYDWLEQLRIPVLSRDDLSYIVILGNQPEACLKKIDLVSCHVCYFILANV
jgi:protein tyrosine phosphatase domain-containing protein 1